MNDFATAVVLWLADYLLLSTTLLMVALLALALLKQPAQRLAVTKSTLVALFLLAALCAAPGWSLVHLLSHQQPRRNESPVVANKTASPIELSPTAAPTSEAPTDFQPTAPIVAHDLAPPPTPFWARIAWPTTLASIYAIGLSCVLARLYLGSIAAHRLVHFATPAPAQLTNLIAELTGNTLPRIRLLLSDKIDVAVAIGIRRPAILLPQILATSPSALHTPHSALKTILAHELAHVANRDLHWLAASRALLVLLWPQPLFWLLRRRMRLDQEALADAAAAELTSRQTYAEQLVAWARQLPPRPAPRLAAAVGLWEGPSQLRQRIALLIDEKFTVLRNCSRRYRAAASILATMLALALSTITVEPPSLADAQDATPVAQNAPTSKPTTPPAHAAEPEIPRPIPNTILGRAVDENDQSIAGAEVFLFRVNRHDSSRKLVAEKTADAAGNFRFEGVVDIAAEFPDGQIPQTIDIGDELLQLVVRAPQRVTDTRLLQREVVAEHGETQTIAMPPAATLRGRVTGPDGKPVAGALVSFGLSPIDRWDGAKSARSDADGNYTIDDVAPFDAEEYRKQQDQQRRRLMAERRAGKTAVTALFIAPPLLIVEHPDFALKRINCERVPGTCDVRLEPAAILAGRVIFSDSGRPAANVLVGASTSRPRTPQPQPFSPTQFHSAKVRTDALGRYRFISLPVGNYDLWAETDGWVNVGIGAVAAAAEKPTTMPDLVLTEGGILRVRLVDDKTRQPIELPARVRASISAVPKTIIGHRPMPYQSFAPLPGGTFEVRVLPGENQVVVAGITADNEYKWAGATMAGQPPVDLTIADGQTLDVDVPVVDAKVAQANAGPYNVLPSLLPKPATVTIITPNVANKPREAIEVLTQQLKDNPDDSHALLARSDAYLRLGEYAKEVADLEHVIRLKPPGMQNIVAHNNLAYILSAAPDESLRDGKRSLELALRAQELAGESAQPALRAELLDTLAAAYAETGEFDQAIKTQQRTIELAPANEDFRKHLELYRAKQPLRETRPEPSSDAAKPNTEDITGQVLKPDGTPAAGVRVIAFSMHDPDNISKGYGYQRTQTDADGRFRLSLFSGGKEVFWILPSDYSQQTHVINDRRGDLGVFKLENGLHLHGRVLDQNGKPIPEIWVNAELKGGPAFRKIEMPVADNIERASLTDADGHFDLGPLPPGTYKLFPDEDAEDDFENVKPHKPLPAAFLPQQVELSALAELDELEIRPVESVTIEVRFVDSKGNPTHGYGFFLIGTTPDGKRLGLRRDQQGQEPVVFVAPKGLEKTVIDFPTSSMRVRRAPDEPWENDHSIDLGTLDRDWREIEAVRYRTPTLLVTAKDADRNPIPSFKPAIYYDYRDQQEERKNRWIGDVRGDVNFEKIAGGGWQSEHLLPDEKFTLTVSADGYKPFEETMSVQEGQLSKVRAVLSKAEDAAESQKATTISPENER